MRNALEIERHILLLAYTEAKKAVMELLSDMEQELVFLDKATAIIRETRSVEADCAVQDLQIDDALRRLGPEGITWDGTEKVLQAIAGQDVEAKRANAYVRQLEIDASEAASQCANALKALSIDAGGIQANVRGLRMSAHTESYDRLDAIQEAFAEASIKTGSLGVLVELIENEGLEDEEENKSEYDVPF